MRRARAALFFSIPFAMVVSMAGVLGASPASAAATDVVINEVMYHPLSDLDTDDFLELANPGSTAVDLSGWTFSGITLTLPAGTTIAAGGYLVVARDAARFQATYGFAPAAVYGGNLSNSGETIALTDAGGATVDSVSYLDLDAWPTKADGTGPSLELIDPTLDNDDPLNWAASTAALGSTPGAANSVRHSGLGPRITDVSATPNTPAANQAVTVTATITGLTSATVRYRTDFAAEQSVSMTSAGGGVYTATIPGAAAGHLVRYRIEASNANGTSRVPRQDDTIVYKGVVAQDGVSTAIPEFQWFIADADYNAIIANPTADISRSAVLAYDGTVYDNVTVSIRGQGSQDTPKPNWKFEMPQGHDLDMPGLLPEPVDEFAMQADWSDVAHGRSLLSFESFRMAGVINANVFPVRTQRNGQFQGVYNYLELFDGTWQDREGYSDDQFFKANINAFDSTVPLADRRFEKKNPDDGDYTPLQGLLNGIALTGNAQHDYMAANTDVPQMINYAAVTAILDHVDSSTKNFYVAQDADTGRWSILPWDLDHTLGNHCCFVNSDFVTPAEPGDRTNDIMDAIFATPAWRDMYFRRLRTLVDQILATGKLEGVYDTKVGPAQPDIALDFAKWPYKSSQTYSQQRSQLFKAIAARRTVFNTDSRVPADQPAAPNIVIDEIQHSPTGGGDAEFLELYNPSDTAIDLSGWSISDGIGLTVQPGTVILPKSTMTFVANDPTFRTTYGSTIFVGGRYTGGLSGGETLTLKRDDGSVADQVTYGGAGWPAPTAGQSLELVNPAADNNYGASWALSAGQGSPGAVNGGSVDATAPGAPGIGTATAGSASATVTWTAPGSDGGSPLTGYQVRVLDSTGTQVGALQPAGAGVTSLTVSGLTNGTAYRFQVAATNSVGTGAYSATSNAVTPTGAVTAPGAPTIGNVSPGNASATVRWTAPASTGGAAITGYQVRVVNAAGSQVGTLRSAGSGATSLVVTGLTNGTAYRFQVAATNSAGTGAYSALSSAVTPTGGTATVPGAPVIGTPAQGARGGALTATARWTPPTSTGGSPITGYQVSALRMSSSSANASVLSTTTSNVGASVRQRAFTLAAGNYRFQVVAVNAVGASAPSARSANVVPR
jgi:CotH protein/lamin tail-like protein/fibronectin type III domain protein